MGILAPRGTKDILPEDVISWQYLEDKIRSICKSYGYDEIRTPIFEETALFQRGIGETTDIVEKEMYTFVDKGGRSMTLRPEGTASVVRAYLEHKMYGGPQPCKLYYMGPMFRYERPQAGRYRQFHQFGAEIIGTSTPEVDAEIIELATHIYSSLGLEELDVQINSIGCLKCRGEYRQVLKDVLAERLEALCPSCVRRYDRNPLRILDCKEVRCRENTVGVPPFEDYLCPMCREHFNKVRRALDSLSVPYTVNPRLVRGFDYYTRTVFEIIFKGLGAQDAIGGGGRYDGLVEMYGGPSTPAVGFAAGLERILLTLEHQKKEFPFQPHLDVYMVTLGDESRLAALPLVKDMRHRGLKVDLDYMDRGIRAQMKAANRNNARFAVIIGDEELSAGEAVVRDMETGTETKVDFAGLVADLLSRQ
jgi:histidyl-tRNA synthetase